MGLTDYKTFLGTNLRNSWASLLKESGLCEQQERKSEDSLCIDVDERGKGLSNPLGNAAVIECSDQHVLLLTRCVYEYVYEYLCVCMYVISM